MQFDIRDRGRTFVEFYVVERENAVPNASGGLNLYPSVGDVINVRLRAHNLNKRLDTCTFVLANEGYFDFPEGCISGNDTAFLDDHPRGRGGIVDLHVSRVSRSEINYRFTVKTISFYTIYIREQNGSLFFDNISRVNFNYFP